MISLPPRYANVPIAFLLDPSIAAPVKETGMQLWAAAWESKDSPPRTPPFTPAEFQSLTGKSQSTLYGHLAALKDKHWLLFSAPQRGTGQLVVEFLFGEPAVQPVPQFSKVLERSETLENADLKAFKELDSLKELKDSQFSETLENPEFSKSLENQPRGLPGKKSSKPRKSPPTEQAAAPAPSVTTTRAITDEYVALLGRDPGTWAEGEGAAAKWIAQRYTVEQFRAVYHHYKAQPFWKDKRVTLRYIKQNMTDCLKHLAEKPQKENSHGKFHRTVPGSAGQPTATPSPARQIAEQLSLVEKPVRDV